ncbi:MAG: transposase, partial [Planctomycetia bacterium]|nr:transposase [Planctomycetia bacterium]
AEQTVLRMVIAFILHSGRMSCLQAAGSIRSEARHRAQIGRLLRRPSYRRFDINGALRQMLLRQEAGQGRFVFIVDATLCSQAGLKTENTYSTGNRQRRPRKGRRYGKQKHARKRCHNFTMGLLITPSGLRIPFSRPHYTREYCRQKGLTHRTTAEAAADLIRSLPLPEEPEVVVLGDTAYDAQAVCAACDERGYQWIFPCNSERVLAGPKPRPKVRSLLKDWPSFSLRTIKLFPGKGPYVNHRRLSPHRIGLKAKPRTFYVHEERREVHSVGEVRLVFSTTKHHLKRATPDDVKILMTNASHLDLREVVELYLLRWQIELFFKELKSTLGFHQYRLRKFDTVESWADLALTTFLYLEIYRAQQLARRGLTDEEKRWWRHQRTHGLCQAVRAASEQSELEYIAERLKTPRGISKLKRLIRNSFAQEYRAAV